MEHLLKNISPHSGWGTRLKETLQYDFPSFPDKVISLKDMGAPIDWKDWFV